MNSGSFFRLDLEASKVKNGITFFNYVDLPDLSDGEDKLRYPIRLSISADSVSIITHYYTTDQLPHHIEEVIINLPYGIKDVEGLSSTIKRLYNTSFPLSDCLYDLIMKRYTDEEPEGTGYYYLRQSQINKDSYSSLFIWGLVKKEVDDTLRINIIDEKGRITKFLRKLLLDFMFDLMHSDVFETSKYYAQMKDGLMKDFFFSSIIKKCEFYYFRRLIREKAQLSLNHFKEKTFLTCDYNYKTLKDQKEELEKQRAPHYLEVKNRQLKVLELNKRIQGVENIIQEKQTLKQLYAERLDIAEKEWIEVIMSTRADQHFSFSPEWYEDQNNSEQNKEIFSVSESWFVNSEEEMSRVVFPLPEPEIKQKWWQKISQKLGIIFYNRINNIHYLNSYELRNIIGSKDDSSLTERITKVSKWFYRRYDFKDAFRLHLFNGGHLLFFLILALFSLGLISFHGIWSNTQWFAIFPSVMAISFLYIAIRFNSIINKLNIERLDDILVQHRLKREALRASVLFVFFSIISTSIFFHTNFIFQRLLLIGIVILLILYFRITQRKSIKNNIRRIITNIHLLLPRLVASITAAWITLVIGNEIFQEHLSWSLCIIISIIVFTFILYENNKVLSNAVMKQRIPRAIGLMIISYSMSLIIGIFAMDILRNVITEETPCMCQKELPLAYSWPFFGECEELTLTIFPEQLIPFSFLAMFIGVFIQMIFEEKNITEM